MPVPRPAPSPTTAQSRLPSLTGMRFLAALMVMLCHAGTSLLPRLGDPKVSWYERLVANAGPVGLSFFFVLSGFVLTWVAAPDDTRVAFWRRRLVKIFPNHLVTLAAAVALMLYTGVAVTTANTVPTLFLVQAWIPRQDVILNFGSNTPSWSLSCELLFYLSFPWLLIAARRIRPQRLWWWVVGLVVAMCVVPLLAGLLPDRPYMVASSDPWWQVWFVYHFPVTRLLEFVLGILTALVIRSGRWIPLPFGVAALLAAGAFTGGALLTDTYRYVAPTALPLALLVGAAATADLRGRRTGCGGRAMVRLGEISYAFYMVHFLVVSYGPIGAIHLENWTKPLSTGDAFLLTGVTLVSSLVLAWLLHTFIEAPAMRRWSRRADPVPTVPPSSTALA
ncbi:acyltransferase family protein [Streptomyces beigongshangae]|uniref:acyltransferase family protein n=1 Tax=Streptomyces beigongshangae TaxID=2841597 RepID=UPI001C84A6ED|nr:acyltransferase [Streptomyces sp. REN17]